MSKVKLKKGDLIAPKPNKSTSNYWPIKKIGKLRVTSDEDDYGMVECEVLIINTGSSYVSQKHDYYYNSNPRTVYIKDFKGTKHHYHNVCTYISVKASAFIRLQGNEEANMGVYSVW